MRTSLIIGTLMAAGLALTGCSSSEVPSPQPPAPGTPPPPSAIAPAKAQEAKPENVDVRFAQQMIAHHEVEEQLVSVAETNTGKQGILELAERIKREHPPTIERVKRWLLEDKQMEPEAVPEEVGPGEGPYMPSVGSAEQLSQLKEAQQGQFAPLWLKAMITHHHKAMRIAHTELAEGTNPEMRAVAQQVVKTRKSELETLKSLQREI